MLGRQRRKSGLKANIWRYEQIQVCLVSSEKPKITVTQSL